MNVLAFINRAFNKFTKFHGKCNTNGIRKIIDIAQNESMVKSYERSKRALYVMYFDA